MVSAPSGLLELLATSQSLSIATTHHCIFTHKHDSLNFPFAPQTLTDFVHLLRADIVNRNNEDRFVPISW